MCDTNPGPVLYEYPVGCGGEAGGRGYKMEGTHVCLGPFIVIWQKPPQYCKVIILQLN